MEFKSIPCVQDDIHIESLTVNSDDGYAIPVRVYCSQNPIINGPVLYYVHGGGFFGGSMDVVEESIVFLLLIQTFQLSH